MVLTTSNSEKIRKLTFLGLMTAMVIVLQLLGSFVKIGIFSISLVLMPIVLGAVVGGVGGGAWLGAVFGATVLFAGDAALFLGIDPAGTIVTVMAKGILCGAAAGLVYKLMCTGKNRFLSVFAAAFVCPVVNTGVFLLGCVLFFMEAINAWAVAEGVNTLKYIFVFLIGANFPVELVINILLAPVIIRLIDLIPTKNKI